MNMRFIRISLLFSFTVVYFISASAQQESYTKYFDSSWIKTSKEDAFYRKEYSKKDSFYQCKIYWMNSGKLFSETVYTDSAYKKPIGLELSYFEDGEPKDSVFYAAPNALSFAKKYYKSGRLSASIFYGNDNITDSAFHFYESGKPMVHYVYDRNTKTAITDAKDENGNTIKDYIYSREAVFPGGDQAWFQYLQRNVRTQAPVNHGAKKGVYNAVVRFVVNKEGEITDVRAETDFGYGIEKEALRVIKKSPKWIPAINLNKKVNAYRRQPLTFVVTD